MLALQKTQPGAGLSLVEVAEPDAPGSGEVLLEIVATGICGSDLSIDRWSPSYESFMGKCLPVTLGHETVGQVIAVGAEVDGALIGRHAVINPAVSCGKCENCRRNDTIGCTDRQAIGMVRNGAFARYCLAPAAYCHVLPEHVPVEVGALAEPLSVGAHALITGGMKAGDRVIVFGPGCVGQCVAALAKHLGASEVVVVGMNDGPRFEVLRKFGIETFVDMAQAGAAEKLAAIAGAGFDLAVDAAGAATVINQALSVLRQEGVLSVAGMSEQPATIDILRVVKYRLQIRGSSRTSLAAWSMVLQAIEADPETFRLLITHRMPLDQAEAALDLCRRGEASKVLLFPA